MTTVAVRPLIEQYGDKLARHWRSCHRRHVARCRIIVEKQPIFYVNQDTDGKLLSLKERVKILETFHKKTSKGPYYRGTLERNSTPPLPPLDLAPDEVALEELYGFSHSNLPSFPSSSTPLRTQSLSPAPSFSFSSPQLPPLPLPAIEPPSPPIESEGVSHPPD